MNPQHFQLTFEVPLRAEKKLTETLILSLSMPARSHLGIIKKFSLHICYYGNSKLPSNI